MVEQITFYTNDLSPFAHRVGIALEEVGIGDQVIRYQLPLNVEGGDKPTWYSEKVNPLGTVPALAYGSQPAPDQPSNTSAKIYESLAIVEFLAELYPDAKLVPSDPVLRAKARAFASICGPSFVAAYRGVFRNSNFDAFFATLDQVQSLLVDGATYAVGEEFTIADISFAPMLSRLEMLLANNFFGRIDPESISKVLEVYKGPKYDRVREYNRRVQKRPSVKKSYFEDASIKYYSDLSNPRE